MARLRVVYPQDTILFITSSVVENLPFVPNKVVNAILEGILAWALFMFGQELIGYCFMANHLHLMLRVTDPDRLSDFIGHIKSESATAINRLLGRESHKVWCDRFDAPIVLTEDKVFEKLAYIYLNPAKARLVNSIDEYPGVSSWSAFIKNKPSKKVRWIKNSTIRKLNKLEMTLSEQIEEVKKLKKVNDIDFDLRITPYAYTETFPQLKRYKREILKQEVVRKVRMGEEEYKKKSPKVMGVRKLVRQRINAPYDSKRQGRRTMFLGSDIDLKMRAINWRRGESKKARLAWATYRNGEEADLPPGFYGPGRIRRSILIGFMDFKF